jgi:hypothetical protein
MTKPVTVLEKPLPYNKTCYKNFYLVIDLSKIKAVADAMTWHKVSNAQICHQICASCKKISRLCLYVHN